MSEWLDAEAHADLALEMYERGRLAEAEAELRKALSLNPNEPNASMMKSYYLMSCFYLN